MLVSFYIALLISCKGSRLLLHSTSTSTSTSTTSTLPPGCAALSCLSGQNCCGNEYGDAYCCDPDCVPEGGSFVGDPDLCAVIHFICDDGYTPWFGTDCGCGCEPNSLPGDFCGGIAGIPCDSGLICIDDPNDGCDPENGGADCGGICAEIPDCVPEGGTFLGTPDECIVMDFICDDGYTPWFDNNCGCGCEPEPTSLPGDFCGGIAGFPCYSGLICIDDPNDLCDPTNGGADCSGICVHSEHKEHCRTYYDGCNTCDCFSATCTERYCEPDAYGPVIPCTSCEDNETMEYTDCGTCDATCDDPNPICTRECKQKCQCKDDTPIYDPINKTCIPLDECDNSPPSCAALSCLEGMDCCLDWNSNPICCNWCYDGYCIWY